jgi:hypothetical protein
VENPHPSLQNWYRYDRYDNSLSWHSYHTRPKTITTAKVSPVTKEPISLNRSTDTMANNNYDPARFKACTRRTVAFSIIFGSLGFILIAIILSVFNPLNDSAKSALNTIMPLGAGFIGSIMAFYFSSEAGENDDDDEEQVFPSHTLVFVRDGVTPVTFKFSRENLDESKTMRAVLDDIAADPENQTSTKPLLKIEENKVLKFSYMENLRTKTNSAENFNNLTLSELSKNTRGNIAVKVFCE